MLLSAGKTDDAVKKISDHVKTNKQEVRPLAAQVEVLWAADKKDDARKAFETLRSMSSTIDLTIPAFSRLTPIATELGFDAQWTQPVTMAADIGARPPLDSLGPFRWQPVDAPHWSLPDVDNNPRALADYQGQPVVVIFYLGAGCLHCVEQLQKFAPKTEEFRKAGYELIAISTDRQKVLGLAYKDLEGGFPFPLVSDNAMDVFKAYRCYDDFEQQALHGTFVIDGSGRIRWQDISYEPFMDPDFVLKEANRLLQQDESESATPASAVTATR
ncbi:MAG: peroxiredoxin family protein [Planctomycetaceae bacterium]